jgi:hypothetical protein
MTSDNHDLTRGEKHSNSGIIFFRVRLPDDAPGEEYQRVYDEIVRTYREEHPDSDVEVRVSFANIGLSTLGKPKHRLLPGFWWGCRRLARRLSVLFKLFKRAGARRMSGWSTH